MFFVQEQVFVTKPDRSEHVVQRSKADGGAIAPMKY